ncbi:MAG: TetR/AcrR family transcriptional regulator [Spirochaetes bacterium]|nr:TetR/AcrR family transcriptional regulator [Spirochaetota bacterium]
MGVIERREREKSIRRDCAIDAALGIYKEEGYHAITMEKIAERAELSRAALYIYFKSKDEILINAIITHAEYFAEQLRIIYDNREKHKHRLLETMWECFENYYEKDPDIFNLAQYFHQNEIIRNLPDYLRDMLYKSGSNVVHIQHSIVGYGVDEGIFIQCDPRTLSEVIWTSFLGLMELERSKYIFREKSHFKVTRDLAIKVFMRGILNQPDKN